MSINIPSGVTTISINAFTYCSRLTSIDIPSSVISIGNRSFSGCINLTNINVYEGNNYYSSEDGVLYNKDKTTLILCPQGKTSVNIPSSVTTIGGSAFNGCKGLTSITISNGVTYIGGNAFYDCTELTSITIPDGVTIICNSAFYNCTALTSITIPSSVTEIGNNAFEDCTSLATINTDRANEDEVVTYNIAKAIIKHITENPKDWDIYRNIKGHVIGKATINGNKVTVTADYFDGFRDSDEDVFFIEIEMKNKRHVSILKDDVNYYIQEDTWTALYMTLVSFDEENLPKLEAELCGK